LAAASGAVLDLQIPVYLRFHCSRSAPNDYSKGTQSAGLLLFRHLSKSVS